MADTAPLTSAHAHARRAAEETEQVRWSEAAAEHQNAASEFARAARTTNDTEALRILALLGQQHLQLARVITLQDAVPEDEPVAEAEVAPALSDEQKDTRSAQTAQRQSPASKSRPTATALAAAKIGSQVRDSSPSLARDIASRRGIPQPARTHPSPAAQARARRLSPESHRRARAAASHKVPPSIMGNQASLRPQQKAKKAEDDDGFAKFYSNLTTGAASKLSSVLAYAGLPLSAEEALPEPTPDSRSKKKSVPAGSESDVKRYFSKAALNAIEDEHRQKGTLGHGFGPAESFYVVPQGGGSYSYAEITRNRAQAPSATNSFNDGDDDDFVDANEVPGPPSPTTRHKRSTSQQLQTQQEQKRNPFGKQRTDEELELENTTLKHTLEQLASRLANFEAHAQDASMAALTQSMMGNMNMRATLPGSELQERVRQLEQQIERQAQDEQKLREEADRQGKMLKKYEGRYAEAIQNARARAKREARKEAAVAENSGVGKGVGGEERGGGGEAAEGGV